MTDRRGPWRAGRLRGTFGLGAIVMTAVICCRCGGDSRTESGLETAPVERATIVARVTASGTLSPLVTVQVGSQVSGRIQELHADFNDQVRKGQMIARIDPRLFEYEASRARAGLEAARAAVARSEAEQADRRQQYERTLALAAERMATERDAASARHAFDAASAGVASARAGLSQAEAGLRQAETNLAYTVIHSPIDGIVISRSIDIGQTVAAAFQAPTLFTIAEDLRRMEVHTSLAEADVGQVAPGMPVEFTVDAFPNDRFAGLVRQVRYSPQTVQNVVTYDAVVSVDNGELKLRPGMTADVSFIIERREGVLSVPNSALRYRPPEQSTAGRANSPAGPKTEGGRTVWVLGSDGREQPLAVRTGLTDGVRTEIADGLAEGQRVVTGRSGGAGQPGESAKPRLGRFL